MSNVQCPMSMLYSDIILTHNNAPFHFEKKTDAPIILEAYNPMCGDKFKIYLWLENEFISEIYFHGYGCAVSKAATSVLLKKILEKNISEAKKIIKNYFFLLENDFEKNILNDKNIFSDEEISAFNAVKKFPERKTCAVLSWEAVNNFLASTYNP